jgi:membrane-associated phospholipid phosphatase
MRLTSDSSQKSLLIAVIWLSFLGWADAHSKQNPNHLSNAGLWADSCASSFLADSEPLLCWRNDDKSMYHTQHTLDSLSLKGAAHQFVREGRALAVRPFGWTDGDRKKLLGSLAITAAALAFDPWANQQLNSGPTEQDNSVMKWLEAPGNGSLYLPLAALLWGQGRARGEAQLAGLGVGLASSVIWPRLLIQIPKYVFQRERPRNGGENPYTFHGPWGSYTHDAFPSGHTATAFAAAAYLRGVKPFQRAWPGQAATILAFGTAIQRLHGGEHWLADVVAGAMIGQACGAFLAKRASGLQIVASPTGAQIIIPVGHSLSN